MRRSLSKCRPRRLLASRLPNRNNPSLHASSSYDLNSDFLGIIRLEHDRNPTAGRSVFVAEICVGIGRPKRVRFLLIRMCVMPNSAANPDLVPPFVRAPRDHTLRYIVRKHGSSFLDFQCLSRLSVKVLFSSHESQRDICLLGGFGNLKYSNTGVSSFTNKTSKK